MNGEQSSPFRGNPTLRFDGMEPAEPRLIAGIAELSGRGHPVGRLGHLPKTRGVHVTVPVHPRPYQRPRRAGAFRGPILLAPRPGAEAKLRCWEWRSLSTRSRPHPPTAKGSQIFRSPVKACPCPSGRSPGKPWVNSLVGDQAADGKRFRGPHRTRCYWVSASSFQDPMPA